MQGHASLESTPLGVGQDVQIQVFTSIFDELGILPTFMKIDVEGHELAMLRGAAQTIARCRPVLLLELDFRHQRDEATRQELLSWLSDKGYAANFVDNGRLAPCGYLVANTDPNIELNISRYVYNWLMLPAE